ncbi:MAG: HIT family protein [Acidobacteriaceae bacterium]
MDHLWTPWRYNYVSRAKSDSRPGVPAALHAWPGDHHCVFCNLVAAANYAIANGMASEEADKAAQIVQRGKYNYVCLNIFPYTSGHVMVVPYGHIDSLVAMNPLAAQEMMQLAQRTEAVFHRVYKPEGINFGLNLGEAAGAGVAGHLHLHALPRWNGDTNFMTVTAETRVLPEELSVTWQRLRNAFDGQTA